MDRSAFPLEKFLGLWIGLESAAFFLGAALHAGLPGLGAFEPRILPAALVEALCGLFLGVATYATLAGRPWASPAALYAHLFSLGGVLLGISALAAGLGPNTALNNGYHSLIFISLFLMLGFLPGRGDPAHTLSQPPAKGHPV